MTTAQTGVLSDEGFLALSGLSVEDFGNLQDVMKHLFQKSTDRDALLSECSNTIGQKKLILKVVTCTKLTNWSIRGKLGNRKKFDYIDNAQLRQYLVEILRKKISTQDWDAGFGSNTEGEASGTQTARYAAMMANFYFTTPNFIGVDAASRRSNTVTFFIARHDRAGPNDRLSPRWWFKGRVGHCRDQFALALNLHYRLRPSRTMVLIKTTRGKYDFDLYGNGAEELWGRILAEPGAVWVCVHFDVLWRAGVAQRA